MKMTDIRKRAKDLGLKTQGFGKVDLIHAIQTSEGNTPCYATGRKECDQMACSWREDCLPKAE